MSFRVEVIPEDPTFNGAILKPLVERVVAEAGRPNARVNVLTNPKASGYQHVVGLMEQAGGIIESYRRRELLLFLPDQDGASKQSDFARLEKLANGLGANLICCAAVEEVETWLLAGHVDKIGQSWSAVRSNASVKENVFAPFLAKHGDTMRPGGGRDTLMRETLSNYSGLKARCPEIAELEAKIKESIAARP
ncbi:MAG: hypothetical protein NTV94_15770 [Planctomycetota bacterium]|nr:hypothetical protein [Planctomycetota bacterium]